MWLAEYGIPLQIKHLLKRSGQGYVDISPQAAAALGAAIVESISDAGTSVQRPAEAVGIMAKFLGACGTGWVAEIVLQAFKHP